MTGHRPSTTADGWRRVPPPAVLVATLAWVPAHLLLTCLTAQLATGLDGCDPTPHQPYQPYQPYPPYQPYEPYGGCGRARDQAVIVTGVGGVMCAMPWLLVACHSRSHPMIGVAAAYVIDLAAFGAGLLYALQHGLS